MFRRIRTFLIVIACLLVVVFSALVAMARHYEPEVKATLEQALNERLNAPVRIGDMELTLIARFPMASLQLHEVLAMEVRTDEAEEDTLLYAKEIHLEFSLLDLLRGNYVVDRIHASDAMLNPALDTNGNVNYLIWKSDSTATSSVIALDRVSCEDLRLRFRDHRNGLELLAYARSLDLNGQFSDALSELDLATDLHLVHWSQGAERLLTDRELAIRAHLAYGGSNEALHITKGELASGRTPIEFTLDLTPGDGGRYLDLRANGLRIPLAEVIALLPDRIGRRFQRYGIQGEADLAVHYEGPLEGKGPSLSIGARIDKGRLKEKNSGVVLQDIRADLALELTPEGVPSKLLVQQFHARSSSGSIGGNWSSNGLTNAKVTADLVGDIDLADLMHFAQIDTLEQVSGHLNANAKISGTIRDVADLRARDLRALRIEGMVQLRNATLKMKGLRHQVEDLDAELTLVGNDADIKHLRCTIQGSQLDLNGALGNLMPYLLFDDQRLVVDANVTSPRMDLAALLSNGTPEGSNTDSADYALVLPSAIELDLKVRVEELTFEGFKASAINGTVRMKDRVLTASPMTFNTASGAVLGTLELDARQLGPSGYPLSIDATFRAIDVAQLFQEFQDFGQQFIGHHHLSGRSDAKVEFRAMLSPALTLDMNSLICGIDIAIVNGGIRDHQPLIDIADHIRNNGLMARLVDTEELRRRLKDVRFARLENRIEIKNRAVNIPAMKVNSSAMDIELSGTHWFDDRIDHHLNFRLGDLFRLGRPLEDEFGAIQDDGTGMRIFLHMYGTASEPLFENDGAMAMERRRQQFQQEKVELKSILREDLGLFKGKGDSLAPPSRSNEGPGTRIHVDWGGSDSSTTEAQGPEPKKKKGWGLPIKDDADKPPTEKIVIED